ncbi:MAG: hypothetical protein K6C41_09140 [Lachnospiraceae bacterium]|nr:hypothetical protein [Lachnospiraceae bacterium]
MISEDEAWARSRLGSLSPEELENPLLFDEEEEIYIQGPGQTFMVDDYVINGGLIMENYSRPGEARVIKSSKQFHLPSFRASLLKSNLVNSLELTEEKRKELLDDRNMELDDIVNRYVSDEEKNRIAKEIKAHLLNFWDLRKALADDPVLNTEEKARMLYNFSKAYASDVAVFHSLYEKGSLTKKREEHLEEYINGLEGLLEYFDIFDNPDKYEVGKKPDGLLLTRLGLRKGSAHHRMFEGDINVLKKAEARAKDIDEHVGKKEMVAGLVLDDEKTQIKTRAEMDSSLSAEQKKGVNKMDSWLIEKGLNSTKRLPFINTIMALSARERLFVYHLIEKDHLGSPTMQDITLSQTSYVPDVTTISWKMYRIPYRLWEKAGHEGLVKHHWEKLEAAMQIVKQPDVVESIQKYADAFKAEKKVKEKLDENDPEYDFYNSVREMTEDRDRKLDDSIKKLSECEEASKKAESAWVYKSRKRAIAREKLMAAYKALNELEKSNKDLTAMLAVKGFVNPGKTKDDLSKNIDKKEITSKYKEGSDLKEYGMYVSGQALALLSKSGSITSLMSPAITAALDGLDTIADAAKISAIGTGLDVANYTTGAFITLKGVHALIGNLTAIKKTNDAINSGDYSKADELLMAAKTTHGLLSGVTTTFVGLKNIQFAQKSTDVMMGAKDVKDAVNSMKANAKKANIAVSAAGLALNGADVVMQGAHLIYQVKSGIKVNELDLHGNDESYMKGLSKLELRNKGRKIVATGFSAATNLGNLASQFLGPAGSLAWGGISFGLSMTSKLADYLMKDASMKKSAEEFFNLIDLSDLVVDDQKENETDIQKAYKKRAVRDLEQSKTAQKELKESLVLHMAAKLGFTSFKSLFKHIVTKYSEFLHYNLFYHDGDKVITDGEKEKYKMSQACADMVRGMGLRVVFPTTKDDEKAKKQRHPSQKMIESKLGA